MGLLAAAAHSHASAQPVSARFVEAPAVQPSVPAPARWWTIFADPALDALIDRGTRDNPDIAAAAARVAIARATLKAARAERLPNVSTIAGAAEQTGALATASGDNGSLYEIGVRAAWEPDVFGRLGKTARAAKLDARAAGLLAAAATLAVQADIATTYFSLRSLDAEQAVLAAAATTSEQTLAILQGQLTSGTLALLELERRRLALGSERLALLSIERQRAATAHALAQLIGAEQLPSPQPAAVNAAIPDIPVGLPSAMLARRPDVAAVIDQVEAARLRHRAAKTAWFPSFSLTANGGQASTSLGDLVSDTARTFGFNLILSLPIFDGGRNAAQVRRAAAEADLAVAGERATILTAFREVEDRLSAVRLLRDEEQATLATAAAGTQARAIMQRRYASGTVSRLDLLDAERSDIAARQRVAAVKYDRAIALVGLIRALGGGWGDAPTTAPPLDLAAN